MIVTNESHPKVYEALCCVARDSNPEFYTAARQLFDGGIDFVINNRLAETVAKAERVLTELDSEQIEILVFGDDDEIATVVQAIPNLAVVDELLSLFYEGGLS